MTDNEYEQQKLRDAAARGITICKAPEGMSDAAKAIFAGTIMTKDMADKMGYTARTADPLPVPTVSTPLTAETMVVGGKLSAGGIGAGQMYQQSIGKSTDHAPVGHISTHKPFTAEYLADNLEPMGTALLVKSLAAADKHVHELLAENRVLEVAFKQASKMHLKLCDDILAIQKLPSDERVRALRKLATSLEVPE